MNESDSVIHRWPLTVPEEALDGNDHVNNVVYLEWMQEVAIRHAEATGAAAATRQAGAVWVAIEHRIRYKKPAFEGDRLEVRTWVATMRRAQSQRRYEVVRLGEGGEDGEGEVLAEGWTDWAFVDAESGRPKRIPPPVAESFVLRPET